MHSALFPLLALFPAIAQDVAKPAPRALDDVESGAHAIDDSAAAAAPTRALVDRARTLAVDRDRVFFDVDAEGDVWARGRTYKAEFARGSATYVPFLGSRAPRNYPLDLRVASVTIGGEAIAFDADVSAVRRGDTIEYARGPFVERYVLTPDSVEQTFVFDDLPRRGEIVVTLGITTELERASDAQGLRFGNDLGHVRYGEAFALHDELAPTRIESRLEGDAIRIVAPAALVEGAVGSFVIDPVISTFSIEVDAPDELAADTAYDSTNGYWLTVSEEVFSAVDHDVHVKRHNLAGQLAGYDYVDETAADWRSPAVANNQLDDQFLVVAARGTAPNREVWGRTVQATLSTNMSAQFQIDPNLAGDAYAPDVGGDSSGSPPGYYCVVWEREFIAGSDYDIHARLVRTDATLVGAGSIAVDDSWSTHDTNPTIGNTKGMGAAGTQHWNVAWQRQVAVGNRNILGARLLWDGTIVDPTFTIASSSLDEINPSATATLDTYTAPTRPWMVAYQIDGGANGWDVRCRTLDGASILSTLDLSEQFPSVALDQITPSCDTDGGKFLVAYDERQTPSFLSTDIKLSVLHSIGGALGVAEGNVSVAPGIEIDLRPRVASDHGWPFSSALVVFDRDDSGPNDVYGTGFDVIPGGPITTFCPGDGSGTACPCGNSGAAGNGCASSVNPAGATLEHVGWSDLSYDLLRLRATGLPATASVLFFQGTAQSTGGAGAAFGDGLRCAAGTVIRLGIEAASTGAAEYPSPGDPSISTRGVVPAAGAVRYYQAWYRNAAPFCTASTFNLTNGLRVQWIP